MASAQPVLVVFMMDVEPDERVIRKVTHRWPGLDSAARYLIDQRPRLEDAIGGPVKFNWLLRMDPQIEGAYGAPDWCVSAHRDIFDQLAEAGDCFGLHVHTWRRAKRFFRTTWLADYEDEACIEHCIRASHETFTATFGHAPVAFSMGDNFMTNHIMGVMEDLGVRIDVTMSSGINYAKKLVSREQTAGHLPDYRNTPAHPFRPSRADVMGPGDESYPIWEVPVTSGVVGKNRDGSDKLAKFLMGSNPDRINMLLDQTLNQANPLIVADSRTDVRTHPKTQARFDWMIGRFAELAKDRPLEFLRLDEFADRLDAAEVKPAA